MTVALGFRDPGRVGFLDPGEGCWRRFIVSLHHTLTLYVLCCVRAKRLKYLMTDFYFTLRLRDLAGSSERCTFGLQSCAIEYF